MAKRKGQAGINKGKLKMKVIDLTHTIKEDMPVYPGTEKPKLEVASTYERDMFKETLFTMFSHTGTHIDPPAHIIEGMPTLDSFGAEQFVGRGLVIDCRGLKEGEEITLELLKAYKDLDKADFLLFNTGWDKRWGDKSYFEGFPCLSIEALDYIIAGSYKGIGFDTISLDPVNSLTRHKRLFSQKAIINVENLKNLDLCGTDPFDFVCLPMKTENSDGAPCRAIGILGE